MRRCRRLLGVLGALVVLVTVPAVPAAAKTDPVKQARDRVDAAKRAANDAANRFSEAQSRYEKLGDDVAELDRRIVATAAEASRYRDVAQRRAVIAYRHGHTLSPPSDPLDALDAVSRRALLDRVNARDNDAVSRLQALEVDLKSEHDAAQRRRDEQRQALTRLQAERRQLDAKLAASQNAQRALEAQMKRDAAARSAAARSRGRSNDRAGEILVTTSGPWTCPVSGAAFTNDWGQPRSGGRHHQGTDIYAPRGAPNVAVVSGAVGESSGGLGGTAVLLVGDDGSQYYYAHLAASVGGSRRVSQGELIGRTGNSGNARGGPTHTHFEVRRGGRRVNPFPLLRSHC